MEKLIEPNGRMLYILRSQSHFLFLISLMLFVPWQKNVVNGNNATYCLVGAAATHTVHCTVDERQGKQCDPLAKSIWWVEFMRETKKGSIRIMRILCRYFFIFFSSHIYFHMTWFFFAESFLRKRFALFSFNLLVFFCARQTEIKLHTDAARIQRPRARATLLIFFGCKKSVDKNRPYEV